jgi:hypothetical protein
MAFLSLRIMRVTCLGRFIAAFSLLAATFISGHFIWEPTHRWIQERELATLRERDAAATKLLRDRIAVGMRQQAERKLTSLARD